jgi:hypothetical protein
LILSNYMVYHVSPRKFFDFLTFHTCYHKFTFQIFQFYFLRRILILGIHFYCLFNPIWKDQYDFHYCKHEVY